MFPCTNAKNISIKCVTDKPGAPNGTNMQQARTPSDWNGMLRRYDDNRDGRLSKKELKAFKTAGSTMPAWRAFRAIRRADNNGDGFVEEAELPGVLKYAREKDYAL